MTYLRWLPHLLLVLLLGVGSTVAWARTHRGYPNAVYYSRSTDRWVLGADARTLAIYYWEDLGRGLMLVHVVNGDGIPPWQLIALPQGTLTVWGSDNRTTTAPLTQQQRVEIGQEMHAVVVGGTRKQGAYYLAHASGPIQRSLLDGQPVLFFKTTLFPNADVAATCLWLDASTLNLVQDVTSYANGVVATDRFSTRLRRLAPGTLPPNFFDPPHTRRSLWDQAVGWLHRHFGLS